MGGEPEERIVDFAVFSDGHLRTAIGRDNFNRPGTAEREIAIGNSGYAAPQRNRSGHNAGFGFFIRDCVGMAVGFSPHPVAGGERAAADSFLSPDASSEVQLQRPTRPLAADGAGYYVRQSEILEGGLRLSKPPKSRL